jgi:monolysocardiolipin acyltransferase
MWHVGMEHILPNEPPYYTRTGKKVARLEFILFSGFWNFGKKKFQVTINIGDPIILTGLLKSLREQKADAVTARKAITDEIQEKLMALKPVTEKLHQEWT